jgi:hypothetical protein
MIYSQNWFSVSWFSDWAVTAGWDYSDVLSDDEEVDPSGDESELRMATDTDVEDTVALQREIGEEEDDSDESEQLRSEQSVDVNLHMNSSRPGRQTAKI